MLNAQCGRRPGAESGTYCWPTGSRASLWSPEVTGSHARVPPSGRGLPQAWAGAGLPCGWLLLCLLTHVSSSAAGNAFCQAAKLHMQLQSKHDSATSFVDAGNAYKKADPQGEPRTPQTSHGQEAAIRITGIGFGWKSSSSLGFPGGSVVKKPNC